MNKPALPILPLLTQIYTVPPPTYRLQRLYYFFPLHSQFHSTESPRPSLVRQKSIQRPQLSFIKKKR